MREIPSNEDHSAVVDLRKNGIDCSGIYGNDFNSIHIFSVYTSEKKLRAILGERMISYKPGMYGTINSYYNRGIYHSITIDPNIEKCESFTFERLQGLEESIGLISNLDIEIGCSDRPELNSVLLEMLTLNRRRDEILNEFKLSGDDILDKEHMTEKICNHSGDAHENIETEKKRSGDYKRTEHFS